MAFSSRPRRPFLTAESYTIRVPGRGPTPAYMMAVGEAPGASEVTHRDEQTGMLDPAPFVGTTGMELDRYLQWVGMDRSRFYLTNLIKTMLMEGAEVTAPMVEYHQRTLVDEIGRVRPRFILAMGRTATRWFLGDVDMEQVHGLPHRATNSLVPQSSIVLPCYHPAAGLHSPDVQTLILYDFEQFGKLVRGQLPVDPPTDLYPDAADGYRELVDGDDRLLPLFTATRPYLAVDTEGTPGREWGLSFSNEPGKAWVIHRDQKQWIEFFLYILATYRPEVVFHNAMYDLEMLRGLGIDILRLGLRIHDTMVMAYNLQVEPQGLKPLAYRLAGMRLGSFDELVSDAEEEAWFEWLAKLTFHKPLPRPEARLIMKGVDWQSYQPMSPTSWAAKLFKEIAEGKLNKAGEPATPRLIRKRFRDMDEVCQEMAVAAVGLFPEVDLDMVKPRDRVIRYAGGDADATIRIFHPLMARIRAQAA